MDKTYTFNEVLIFMVMTIVLLTSLLFSIAIMDIKFGKFWMWLFFLVIGFSSNHILELYGTKGVCNNTIEILINMYIFYLPVFVMCSGVFIITFIIYGDIDIIILPILSVVSVHVCYNKIISLYEYLKIGYKNV